MSIEKITITQKKVGFGFGVSTHHSLQGVMFENGKIAYLNMDEDVCAAPDEKALVKTLKQDAGCIEVHVTHEYKV
jgi:hypothetical protein